MMDKAMMGFYAVGWIHMALQRQVSISGASLWWGTTTVTGVIWCDSQQCNMTRRRHS